jgi:hypothetical protein
MSVLTRATENLRRVVGDNNRHGTSADPIIPTGSVALPTEPISALELASRQAFAANLAFRR